MATAARAHMSQSCRDVLNFIRTQARDHHRVPTLMEISRHFGWTTKGAAWHHVRHLRDLGYLDMEAKKTRTMVLTPLAGNCRLPFCGRIPAGKLSEAIGNELDAVDFDSMFPAEDGHDAMKVTDDSMLTELMQRGDWVIRDRSKKVVGVVRTVDAPGK